MSLKLDDIVIVCVKVPSRHHKIIDLWEDKQYQVLSQLDNQPVFQVQPEDAATDENNRILHRNMLFPIQTVTHQDLTTTTESVDENRKS